MVLSESNATIIAAILALGGSLFIWWRSNSLAQRIRAQEKAGQDRHNFVEGYRNLVADLQRNNRALTTRVDALEKERRETRILLSECEEQNAVQSRRIDTLERRLGIEGTRM